ncbi:MAG: Rieske 2Fe-2S domain-containing protein [Pseudomonadota bacterium]|jgi:nitrite reductase/ring-hydroxylating ferredoxin subunit
MAESKRLICASAELAEGGRGVRFETGSGADAAPAFVVRFRGEARAYLNRCGHTPMELDWKPGEFFDVSGLYLICATHGALFDPATGACLGGRCNGRGLDALRMVEENGEVFLIQEGD